MIDVKGIDKSMLLQALYNHARRGWPDYGQMSRKLAHDLIGRTQPPMLSFNYLGNRPLKIDISGDSIDEYAYDRDNGIGAAQKAVDVLLEELTRP